MKKFLSALLALTLFASCVSMFCFADLLVSAESGPVAAVLSTNKTVSYAITNGGAFKDLSYGEGETLKTLHFGAFLSGMGTVTAIQLCYQWGGNIATDLGSFTASSFNTYSYNKAWNELFKDDLKDVSVPVIKPATISGTQYNGSIGSGSFATFTINVPKEGYVMNYQTRYLLKDGTNTDKKPSGILNEDYAVYEAATADYKTSAEFGLRINGSYNGSVYLSCTDQPSVNENLSKLTSFTNFASFASVSTIDELMTDTSVEFVDQVLGFPSDTILDAENHRAVIDAEGKNDLSLFTKFGSAVISRSTEKAHSGRFAIKCVGGNFAYESLAFGHDFLSAVINEAGTYELSGYLYVDTMPDTSTENPAKLTTFSFNLNNRQTNTSYYGNVGSFKTTTVGEWVPFKVVCSFPADGNIQDPNSPDYWLEKLGSLAFDGVGLHSVFYVDDIVFRKMGELVGAHYVVSADANYYNRLTNLGLDWTEGTYQLSWDVYNESDEPIWCAVYMQGGDNGWTSFAGTGSMNKKRIEPQSHCLVYTPTYTVDADGYVNGSTTKVSALTFRFDLAKENGEWKIPDGGTQVFIKFNGSDDFIKQLPSSGTWAREDDEFLPDLPECTPTPVPQVFVRNGDAENGSTNWSTFSAGNGGTVSVVSDTMDGVGHSVKFTPSNNAYSSVAFDFGPAILDLPEIGYYGGGSGYYKISFDAKATADDQHFGFIINSQKHSGPAAVAAKTGKDASNYVNTWTDGQGVVLNKNWQHYTVFVNLSQKYINTITDYFRAGETTAKQLILRLDGSNGAYKTERTVSYFLDNVMITPSAAPYSGKVTLNVSGNGSVTSVPRIDELTETDTKITVSASPSANAVFNGWFDKDGRLLSSNPTCELDIVDGLSVTARFLQQVTVSVVNDGHTVVALGEDTAFTSGVFPENTKLSFYLEGKTGYEALGLRFGGDFYPVDKNGYVTFTSKEYSTQLSVLTVPSSSLAVYVLNHAGDTVAVINDTASVTTADIPAAAARVGLNFVGWKMGSETYANTELLVSAIRSLSGGSVYYVSPVYVNNVQTFTVAYDGTEGTEFYVDSVAQSGTSGSFAQMSLVKLKAPEMLGGNQFAYWYELVDGQEVIRSFHRICSFYLMYAVDLRVKYVAPGTETAIGQYINVTAFDKNPDAGTLTIISERELTDDVNLTENAIIVIESKDELSGAMVDDLAEKGTASEYYDAEKIRIQTAKGQKLGTRGIYIITKKSYDPLKNYYAKAYVSYTIDAVPGTVYSVNNFAEPGYTDQRAITVLPAGNLSNRLSTFEGFRNMEEAEAGGLVNFSSASLSLAKDSEQGTVLKLTNDKSAWSSFAVNLKDYIKTAGVYSISFKYKVNFSSSDGVYYGDLLENPQLFGVVCRTDAKTGFTTVDQSETSHYCTLGGEFDPANEEDWYTFRSTLTVKESDLSLGTFWNLCLDHLTEVELALEEQGITLESLLIDDIVVVDSQNTTTAIVNDFDAATLAANGVSNWSNSVSVADVSAIGGTGNALLVNTTNNYATFHYYLQQPFAATFNEPGLYRFTYDMYVTPKEGQTPDAYASKEVHVDLRTTGTGSVPDYSFSNVSSTNYFVAFGDANAKMTGQMINQWKTRFFEVTFTAADIAAAKAGKTLDFCLDGNLLVNCNAYVDNFRLEQIKENVQNYSPRYAMQWIAEEFIYNGDFASSFDEHSLTMTFTKGDTIITREGFWDGFNVYRCRVALTETGVWDYVMLYDGETVDSGTIECKTSSSVYGSEDREIFVRGFVDENGRFFEYADGTPFYYLADTHWSLGAEMTTPTQTLTGYTYGQSPSGIVFTGNSADSVTYNLIDTMLKARTAQGFTVIQSEPIGTVYDVEQTGVTQTDIYGFRLNDTAFKKIALAGFVHSNAELIFPSSMDSLIMNHGGLDTTKPLAYFKVENVSAAGNPTEITKAEYESAVFDDTSTGTLKSGVIACPTGIPGSYFSASQTLGSNVVPAKNATEYYVMYDYNQEFYDYLDKLCEYWVARYGAYPVMWSLGQEVDNDFYAERRSSSQNIGLYSRNNAKYWNYVNNPYFLMAEFMNKHDNYKHPLTAHQESISAKGTACLGMGEQVSASGYAYSYTQSYTAGTHFSQRTRGTAAISNSYSNVAYPSSFRNVTGHTWIAAQLSPNFSTLSEVKTSLLNAHDYAENGDGKPVVNYEPGYWNLWAKNYTMRLRGWFAYLSGFAGFAFGANDCWNWLGTYDKDTSQGSNVNGDKVTGIEKIMTNYVDGLNANSAAQLGYIPKFFTDTGVDFRSLTSTYAYNNDNFTAYRSAYNGENSSSIPYFMAKQNDDVFIVYVAGTSMTTNGDNAIKSTVVLADGTSVTVNNGYYPTTYLTEIFDVSSFSANQALIAANRQGGYNYPATATVSYNKAGKLTGLNSSKSYTYAWFNPVTGQWMNTSGTAVASYAAAKSSVSSGATNVTFSTKPIKGDCLVIVKAN